MTTTPPEAPLGPPPPDPAGDHGPRVDRDQVRDLGRLRRSLADRKVAGVAGGLGRHLDIDPLVLRVAFVVLVFFGGAGLILYGACWLLVPEDGSDKAAINLDEKSRSVVLIVAGVIAALAMLGDSWGDGWFPWPLAVVALIALWLLTRNNSSSAARQDRSAQAAPPYAPPYAPTGAPPGTPADTPTGTPASGQPYGPATAPADAPASAAVPAPTWGAPPPPQQAYLGPPYQQPPYQQPIYSQPIHREPIKPFHAYTRPQNPRKRGPILFWLALALIALGIGVLGIVDLAGVDVAAPAYPTLAVAISGVMLVVGAFYGRAGGIIAIGLVGVVAMIATTLVNGWEVGRIKTAPDRADAVLDSYSINNGEIRLDLRDVVDVAELDGRTIELETGAGRIEVLLPVGLGATVRANIDGPGDISLFGHEESDWDFSRTAVNGAAEPHITIVADLTVGQIEVQR